MRIEPVKKPQTELQKMPTKRLLAYYRSERKKFNILRGGFICKCCREWTWNIGKDDEESSKALLQSWRNHLTRIKVELDKKEHIKKND